MRKWIFASVTCTEGVHPRVWGWRSREMLLWTCDSTIGWERGASEAGNLMSGPNDTRSPTHTFLPGWTAWCLLDCNSIWWSRLILYLVWRREENGEQSWLFTLWKAFALKIRNRRLAVGWIVFSQKFMTTWKFKMWPYLEIRPFADVISWGEVILMRGGS